MVKNLKWASKSIIKCVLGMPNVVVKTVDGFDPDLHILKLITLKMVK